ncbi:MAG: GFA family protein, partial [Luminiphilus sp.]
MGTISGSCFCQAVQYELMSESQMQGLCYCTDCQRVGGSSHWTSYAVTPSDFHLLQGTLTGYTYDPGSGREVTRHFCGTCGTQIMVQSDALGVASVNAMTLDEAGRFIPRLNYFSDSAPGWCQVDQGLAKFEE